MRRKPGFSFGFAIISQPISPSRAIEKSAEVNSEVQPRRWAATRLANVDPGATLEIKVQLDGQATIILVDEPQLKGYPRVARPLFRTETRGRAQFSYAAPKSGNYYLIVDNRKSALKRKYSLSIKASLDLPSKSQRNRESATGNDPLEFLNRVIQTAFIVDPLSPAVFMNAVFAIHPFSVSIIKLLKFI